MSSPTIRSLALLRELGYTAKVVEHWNPYAKIRQDLFGADILALKPGKPVLVAAATTRSNRAARRTKLDGAGFTALWEGAGAQLEVWSWTKQGSKGQRKTWTVRRGALSGRSVRDSKAV